MLNFQSSAECQMREECGSGIGQLGEGGDKVKNVFFIS